MVTLNITDMVQKLKINSMKHLLLMSCLVFISKFGHTQGESIINQFEGILNSYVDSVNSEGDNEYRVFVAYVYDYEGDSFKFTLDYILNSREYKYLKESIFYKLVEGEFVLLKTDRVGIKTEELISHDLGFIPIQKNQRVKLVQKLYPSVLGGFTYSGMRIVGAYKNGMFTKECLSETNSPEYKSVRIESDQ